ncbi:MAG TPA: peptidogalycan biosysnthesis protein, partial [Labilithrix sp.]
MALTLRVVEHIRDVPEDAWMRLVTEDSSPFVEYPWLATLEDAGCVGERAGWIPRHLALEEDGELVAAAPAYVKLNSEGEFVYDWSWADLSERIGVAYYPKLVFAIPFTPATGEKLVCAPGEDREELIHIVAHAARGLAKEAGLSGVHTLFPREDEAREW